MSSKSHIFLYKSHHPNSYKTATVTFVLLLRSGNNSSVVMPDMYVYADISWQQTHSIGGQMKTSVL